MAFSDMGLLQTLRQLEVKTPGLSVNGQDVDSDTRLGIMQMDCAAQGLSGARTIKCGLLKCSWLVRVVCGHVWLIKFFLAERAVQSASSIRLFDECLIYFRIFSYQFVLRCRSALISFSLQRSFPARLVVAILTSSTCFTSSYLIWFTFMIQ